MNLGSKFLRFVRSNFAVNQLRFTGTYDASYETPALLSNVIGTWRGKVISPAGTQNVIVTADANGGFSCSVTLCTFTGTIASRPSGKAVFKTTITFAPTGCVFNGQTLQGISVVNAAGPRALFTAALLPDGSS
jgi:hypothetical protein